MVTLDFHRHPFAGFGIDVGIGRFDHVGIEGSLGQIVEGSEALGLFLEHPNKLVTDAAAFFLGIGDAIELFQEALAGIDVFHVNMELLGKQLHQSFRFVLAHEPLIDEHTGDPIADRLVKQERQRRRIDTSRQR